MKRFSLKGLLLVVSLVCFSLVVVGLVSETARLKSRYSSRVSTVPPASGYHIESITDNNIYIGVGADTIIRVRLVARDGDQQREIGRTTVSQGNHVLSFFQNRAEGQVGYCVAGEIQSIRCPPNARAAVKPALNVVTAPGWEILWKVNAHDWSEQWTVEIQEEQNSP